MLNKLMKRTRTMRVITQNVQALPLMPQGDVVSDVLSCANQGTVIGWQEIGPERYDAAVHELERDGKWETYWGKGRAKEDFFEKADNREPGGYESPISWRTGHWEFVRGGRWLLHDGLAGVMKSRWLTWVLLRDKRTGALAFFLNFHLIAGAWNDKDKPYKEERPDMWRDGWEKILDFVEELIKDEPEAAICGMGDFNANLTRDKKEFGKQRVAGRTMRFTFPGAIDHHFLIDGDKYKWNVKRTDTLRRNSDHAGRRVKARLTWK